MMRYASTRSDGASEPAPDVRTEDFRSDRVLVAIRMGYGESTLIIVVATTLGLRRTQGAAGEWLATVLRENIAMIKRLGVLAALLSVLGCAQTPFSANTGDTEN